MEQRESAPAATDELTQTMDDYWKVQRVATDTPLGLGSEIQAIMARILKENEVASPAKKRCPIVLRCQMYMLTQADNNNCTVLHIAAKHGLHLVTHFLVQKAMEFGVFDIVFSQTDSMTRSPVFLLCSRGYKAPPAAGADIPRVGVLRILLEEGQSESGTLPKYPWLDQI